MKRNERRFCVFHKNRLHVTMLQTTEEDDEVSYLAVRRNEEKKTADNTKLEILHAKTKSDMCSKHKFSL